MKKATIFFTTFLIGFIFFAVSSMYAQVIDMEWNTFHGSSSDDVGYAVATDSLGNIYVTGYSEGTWGSPVNAFSGDWDVFVAKLDSSGNLVWNTFLGSYDAEAGQGITLDGSGNIYVTGYASATWGTPINAHSGGDDAFVAYLDNSGSLQWHTFLGSSSGEYGQDITLDSSGNIYVVGDSSATWGTPVNAHSGNSDAFAAKLDSSGNLQWHTFLGCSSVDNGYGLCLNSSGDIYVTGRSYGSWGSPIDPYFGGYDAFVACLDGSGNLSWNTFLGPINTAEGRDIVLDTGGNIFITGESYGTWGSPVNAYTDKEDIFVAKLNSSGSLLWNTFLGSIYEDVGTNIALDSSGDIIIYGDSNWAWGTPINPHSGNRDAFVIKLDGSGILQWHTFLGSSNADYSGGMTLDDRGNILVSGRSYATWGSPINAHNGDCDAFVARITPLPTTDIKANGSDGPVSITQSDTLQIRISLNTNGSTADADFWLAYRGPSGWIHYNNSTKKWEADLGVTYQGPLMDLNNKKVFQKSGLTPGTYRFYFGVDMNMDGNLTKSCLYYDEVKVTVTQ